MISTPKYLKSVYVNWRLLQKCPYSIPVYHHARGGGGGSGDGDDDRAGVADVVETVFPAHFFNFRLK